MAAKSNAKTAPVNEGEKMVTIKLAKGRKDGKGLYVNVNNHSMWIPRGEKVEVPWFIAEVLETSAEQDERTAALIDQLSNDSSF